VVSHRWAGTGSVEQLKDGDVLVSVGGRDVGTIGELDAALASADTRAVRVCLFRPGESKLLEVDVDVFDATEGRPLPLDRLVLWAGSALCSTPSLVRWLWRCPAGVYVSGVAQGSPARHHRLAPGSVIVSVDEVPTPNLDVFLAVVQRKGHNQSLRVRTVNLRGKEAVTTLTTDDVWWPTHDVSWHPSGQWLRTTAYEAQSEDFASKL
jgi:S1-C subfamily serine protease